MSAATNSKPYAQRTTVDPFKTLGEIDKLLAKAGATDRAMFNLTAREGVYFKRDGIVYKVSVWVPQSDDEAKGFVKRMNGFATFQEAERARRLRVLKNVIQSKILSVDEEVYAFEEVFGADIVVNEKTGETVGEYAVRATKDPALKGAFVSALPMPGGGN